MKVLFITSAYPTHRDDARGIFIHRLARELCRKGLKVTVIAPGAPSASSYETMDGVEVHRAYYWIQRWQYLTTDLSGIVPNLKQRPWLLFQVPLLISALTWKAVGLAKSVDIIHAHWLYPAGIAGLIASTIRRIPLVVTSHGGDLNLARCSKTLTFLSKRLSLASSKCVGVSEDLCRKFISFGVSRQNVASISYGVDEIGITDGRLQITTPQLEVFRKMQGFRLLYLGSLNHRKSVETLIVACHRLEQRNYSVACAVVGSGPTKDKLIRLALVSSSGGIQFFDPVAPSEVPAWMAAADILVLPSISEGRPVVVLEAMAMGIPVVATDIPGTRELVRNGETGFLFAPGDSEQLVRCIEIAINNKALLTKMGQRAKDYVESDELTTLQIARKHITLYESTIQSQ
jgi:glycosyltransferase involved in cell wall biosynthesis